MQTQVQEAIAPRARRRTRRKLGRDVGRGCLERGWLAVWVKPRRSRVIRGEVEAVRETVKVAMTIS